LAQVFLIIEFLTLQWCNQVVLFTIIMRKLLDWL